MARQSLYIQDYNRLRDVVRYLCVYGCYSRDDFPDKGVAKRKYDEILRYVRQILDGEYFVEERRQRKKVVRLHHERLRLWQNYLFRTYDNRVFTGRKIALFFLLQQLLDEHGELAFGRVVECIEEEHVLGENPPDTVNTVRVQLNELADWDLVQKRMVDREAYYAKADDYFADPRLSLTTDELQELYAAVEFFMQTEIPTVAGYYLHDTLERYLRQYRDTVVVPQQAFTYRYLPVHAVLDEEVVVRLLYASFHHLGVQICETRGSRRVVYPIQVVLDLPLGRWYVKAFAYVGGRRHMQTLRIDRIKACVVQKRNRCPAPTIRQRVLDDRVPSWNVALPGAEQSGKRVCIRFRFEPDTAYIGERVRRELRHAQIVAEAEDMLVVAVTTHDLQELKPWLLSFHTHAEVLPDHYGLRQEMQDAIEGMLRNYGVVPGGQESQVPSGGGLTQPVS